MQNYAALQILNLQSMMFYTLLLAVVFFSFIKHNYAIPRPFVPQTQIIFTSSEVTVNDFPTVRDSAILARRLLRQSSIGTLSTVFPEHAPSWPARPPNLAGLPIGLPDYVADCEREQELGSTSCGNPTLLAFDIATNFRNAAAGSNVSLTLQWVKPAERKRSSNRGTGIDNDAKASEREERDMYSQAAMPRVALLGYIEYIHPSTTKANSTIEQIRECFVNAHPDAASWVPDAKDKIHESHWVRLVVEQIYWVGGFGNVAYIGWIPVSVWQSVTEGEIKKAILPGETS